MTRNRLPSTNLGVPVLAILTMACALPVLAVTNITTCTTITAPGDYSLTADITCPADGIDIKASGVSLKLNGHRITGPGSTGVGVNVGTGLNHVAVEGPGLIQKFLAGAIFDTTSYSQIDLVTLAANSGYGVLVNNSSFITIGSNVLTKNGSGIVLGGSPGTSSSIVQYNDSSANAFDGIAIGSGGGLSNNNTVNNNTVDGNVTTGIVIYSGSGNRLSSNAANGNPFGIAIEYTGNQATNNTALGNVSGDLFDLSSTCAGDAWGSNVFFSANASCIH